MKTRLNQLYQNIRAKVAAIKNSVAQMWQNVLAWFARKRRAILRAFVIFFVALLASVALLYLWRRSPALRAAMIGMGARVTSWLTYLRNPQKREASQIRVPVLQPEQSITLDGLEKLNIR